MADEKSSDRDPNDDSLEAITSDVAKLTPRELWEQIGFHRPVGGIFYQLPFMLVQAMLGLVLVGVLFNLLYPFPESMGYRAAITGLFSLFFYTWDLGTANIINRFIGETNVKNPADMIKYIQYFIWYQMFTGLLQTTIISAWALFVVPLSDLSYAVWIIAIYSTVQFPGFLGIFRSVLGCLQQFNKTTILNFLSGELFQRFTEIVFVLIGRWWGLINPDVGEIMGIAIGATIGFYVDDFITTLVSAKYFTVLMKGYGITARDCFHHDFDRALVKRCLIWGIKSGFPNFFWTLNGYVSLMLWLSHVPQYTTFTALAGLAGMFGGLMNWRPDLGGAISEAYFNGKERLVQYYMHQYILITGMLQFLMISIGLAVILVLEPILIAFGLEFYLLSVFFILPRMIRDSQQPYNCLAEGTTTGTGHLNFQVAIDVYEALLAMLSWVLVIVVFRIPQTFGVIAVAWVMPCAELPAILSKVLISLVYVHKRIVKIRVPWVRAFLIPAASSGIVFGLVLALVAFFFFPVYETFGVFAALLPSVPLILIVFPICIYFPLTGFFGAWDAETLDMFEKATMISGPGKIIALPLLKLVKKATTLSPFHDKLSMDNTRAVQEARELMVIKIKNLKDSQ